MINHLKMALFYDPHNHKYTINMIKVLLDNKNYTQAEEISKILLYKNGEEIIKLLLAKDWFGQWFGNVFDSFINNIDLNFPYTCYITARIMEYKKETQSANAIYTLINNKITYPTLKKIIQNRIKQSSLEIDNLKELSQKELIKYKMLDNIKLQNDKLILEIKNLSSQNDNIKSENQKLQKLNTDLYFVLNYGTAKSRIKNQLTYKLGEAMIENSKSIWGYIKMPYILSYIKETHQKNQKLYQEKIKANPSLKLPPLETYPDYNEAIKIKEHLSYKLGEALINADKSKLGYLTLWFKCKKIANKFNK